MAWKQSGIGIGSIKYACGYQIPYLLMKFIVLLVLVIQKVLLMHLISYNPYLCDGVLLLMNIESILKKDAALARRFQSILAPEPTPELATKILFGLREKFQAYHDILISDEAIKQAVKLPEKHITERRLLDEACSKLRIDIDIVLK